MERALVAQQVANKLLATENAIDRAIADASSLVAELIKAKTELGVSVVFADEAFKKTTAAMAALGEARSAVAAAHNELADAKLRVGVRTKMTGFGGKPSSVPIRHTAVDLREVG